MLLETIRRSLWGPRCRREVLLRSVGSSWPAVSKQDGYLSVSAESRFSISTASPSLSVWAAVFRGGGIVERGGQSLWGMKVSRVGPAVPKR